MMECDICHRGHDAQRLPFLCAVDARNRIYMGRMRNLEILLENDGLQTKINTMLEDAAARPASETVAAALAERKMAQDQTEKIMAVAAKLREDMEAARAEIQARKAAIARRRLDLTAVSQGLADRRARQQKEVEKSTQVTIYRWAESEEDMARTRSFLCAEAAMLYGLERFQSSPNGRYEYYLGKLPVVDLSGMNNISPEVISTSLSHIAHILMLASHYLAIRLPAEITLPHRDYPRPTIFNLAGSYKHAEVTFPNTPGSILPVEARSSDTRHVPRPRPLFVDKPLPQLSKEDPTTYSYFIEGVTLLAYDIAWLCSSQGISVGEKTSFDDICNMGRNLYNLLINQRSSNKDDSPGSNGSGKTAQAEQQDPDAPQSCIGHYSHGTMHRFLGGAEGTELIRSFKLPGPMKLADRLKKKLLGDAPAPDWEILEDDEWKVEETRESTPGDAKEIPSVAKSSTGPEPTRSGTSGWMKLKSR
ncbi:UV radiation resistance protein and autophagy-related subunit 14-domain-containing protein [Stachybotrys elegans]|uniref:Autophagy-related protein 14 n=1 Tax=Stachybotrys elegans TaxID=80388 RepID=A0A8K0STB5_9HYPO|nr:UV radiation resistance protein and autophagy-related subunit 14-domain-containing protein [Stachybotrys elegans]